MFMWKTLLSLCYNLVNGVIAQLVERHSYKVDVIGSSPISPNPELFSKFSPLVAQK